MDWDKLQIFYAVANAKSFTHAGEVLHLSQSAISADFAWKTAWATACSTAMPGLILTEQGEILFKAAHQVRCGQPSC